MSVTSLTWVPVLPPWALLALAVGLLAVLLLSWRRLHLARTRSWPLLVLRGLALGLVLVILANPTRVTEARTPPRAPEVLALVDCSRSMALDRPVPRVQQVKNVLAGVPSRDDGPRLRLVRFGDRLATVTGLAELAPTDDATRLRESLERLPGHFGPARPAAVVVFSDGRAADSEGLAEVAQGYARLGVPLSVYPVGDRVAGDVAIHDVVAPREAPAGARLPVRVVLRSRGLGGRRAVVALRPLEPANAAPLASMPVTLADGQQPVDLLIEQAAAGRRLAAEVTTFPDEALLDNNRVPVQVGARSGKVRVIYMEGTTGNEYAFVRDALVEDPNIEVLTLLAHNQYAAQQTLFRVGDPARGYPTTREELFGYDVVICSDIARAAFTQPQLDWTVELVAKRGGGFAMVGGNTSFGAGFWDRTVWDGLIPVDMGGQTNDPTRGTSWNTPFKAKVPVEAERHPIWRIVDDPRQNRRVLDAMPPFTGTNLIPRLKPGATLLAVSDRPLPRVGVAPVFACESYGQGRTFAMAPDTTVDWGTYFERNWGEGDNRYFRKFWRNVVHWLAENSSGAGRRLRVSADRVLLRPGQPVELTARAFDDKLEETTRYRLTARLFAPGAAGAAGAAAPVAEVRLDARPDGTGYSGRLAPPPARDLPLPAGGYPPSSRALTLRVTAQDGEREVASAAQDLTLIDDPAELENPQPDRELLESLARAAGGRVLTSPAELSSLLSTFSAGEGEKVVHASPAWDRLPLWLLLAGLLGVEWALRRWWGLA